MNFLLALAVASSVFQFYIIPVAGVYPSLTLLAAFALFLPILLRRKVPRLLSVGILATLIIIQTLSLLWSPDKGLGIRTIMYMFPFLTILVASYWVALDNEGVIYKVILLFAGFALVEAGLIILFRVRPGLEEAFLKSAFAQVFISKNVLIDLYTTARNNVLDQTKAGGFFVNANVAAAFAGGSAFILWGAANLAGQRWLKPVALIMLISVWFSGSKAGIALSVILTAVYFLLLTRSLKFNPLKRLKNIKVIPLVVSVVIVATVIVLLGHRVLLRYTHNVGATVGVRMLIWTYAWQSFLKFPIQGQGYGGWQHGYPIYAKSAGVGVNYPPHNTLIYLWSQNGIFAALLGIAFMGAVLWLCIRLLKLEDDRHRPLIVGTLCAFTWIFIQGMGENFGLLGDIHMQPVFALVLGLLYARLHKLEKGTLSWKKY